jgi:hypothetical protein
MVAERVGYTGQTFRVSQFQCREVVAQQLRVSIVTFAVTAATTHIATPSWSTVTLAFTITLVSWTLIDVFTVKSLFEILDPRVHFGLSLQEALANVLADYRKII